MLIPASIQSVGFHPSLHPAQAIGALAVVELSKIAVLWDHASTTNGFVAQDSATHAAFPIKT
jgi:hypothetical protein